MTDNDFDVKEVPINWINLRCIFPQLFQSVLNLTLIIGGFFKFLNFILSK